MWRGGELPPLRGEALARKIGTDLVECLLPAWRRAPRQEMGEVARARDVLEVADRPWEEVDVLSRWLSR